MPRPLRIEYPNAWYHVTNCGAGGRAIFPVPQLAEQFIALFDDLSQLFGLEIHAYCLLEDSYHLLVKTPNANLARAMRHLNGLYTKQYNRHMETDGPLFKGRYKTVIVDENHYLPHVSRYIHLLPVTMGLLDDVRVYRWSSYRYYVTHIKKPAFLSTKTLLPLFNSEANYERFVTSGLDEQTKKFYSSNRLPAVFGDAEFKQSLANKLNEKHSEKLHQDFRVFPSIQSIKDKVSKHFGVHDSALLSSRRGQENLPRIMAIYLSRKWGGHTLSSIAAAFQMQSHTAVSMVLQRLQKQAHLERIQQHIQALEQDYKGEG